MHKAVRHSGRMHAPSVRRCVRRGLAKLVLLCGQHFPRCRAWKEDVSRKQLTVISCQRSVANDQICSPLLCCGNVAIRAERILTTDHWSLIVAGLRSPMYLSTAFFHLPCAFKMNSTASRSAPSPPPCLVT